MGTLNCSLWFSRLKLVKSIDLHQSASLRKQESLLFYLSVQHVKNVLMYNEYKMWQLIYSKESSTREGRVRMSLNGMSFLCRAQVQDVNILMQLRDTVFIRTMSCQDSIEKISFSKVWGDIRAYSAVSVPPWSDNKPNYCTLSAGAVLASLQSQMLIVQYLLWDS